MKRYLFFLRHFNDIDNIAPAIYFFLEESRENSADVLLYDEAYGYQADPNLHFLKETFGSRFSFRWLGEYCSPGARINVHMDQPVTRTVKTRMEIAKLRIASYISLFRSGELHIENMQRLARKNKNLLESVFLKRMRKGLLNPAIVCRIMGDILAEDPWPSLVAFDINRSYEIEGLLDALRANGVDRIICLPVSPILNYNVLRQKDFIDIFSNRFRRLHDYHGVDAIGYVDNYFVESYNELFRLMDIPSDLEGKTTALGSVRYCPEWIPIREKMIPGFEKNTDKIKLVFFLSRPISNVNWEEVEIVFRLLSLYPDYEVVVKPHTRDDIRDRRQEYANITFRSDIDSSALINWAEVILFWSTSVAIEGYLKGKTMVCLAYIVGNRNLYEKFDAGYIAHCRDDLVAFLVKYKTDKKSLPYNEEGISRFIGSVIVPGGESVPQNYLDFMERNELTSNPLTGMGNEGPDNSHRMTSGNSRDHVIRG
jgi:hypothetical protein